MYDKLSKDEKECLIAYHTPEVYNIYIYIFIDFYLHLTQISDFFYHILFISSYSPHSLLPFPPPPLSPTTQGMKTYSTNGICAEEMTEVVKWLKLAEEWSNKHPDVISPDVGKSLGPLIQSFETG